MSGAESTAGGDSPRVAFVWAAPRSPATLSGMPWAMEHALAGAGLRLELIFMPDTDDDGRDLIGRASKHPALALAPRRVVQAMRKMRRNIRAARERAHPEATKAKILESSRRQSLRFLEQLRDSAPDAIFGSCISSLLNLSELPAPLVYFSDATARVLNEAYEDRASRGEGYHAARDHLEACALSVASHAVFASEWARSSAVEHYGMARERTSIAPMGANITVEDLQGAEHTPKAPERDNLRLCIVAADPKRKGVDVAVRATELLREAGWNATIDVVGPPTALAQESPAAEAHGRLMLSKPEDRLKMARIMADAHIHILPSRAEAFGIAACEAAHFGRPAVVSDAGGLGTIVLDGRTGRVLAKDSGPEAYARAALEIIEDPARYEAMSKAARKRAVESLTWEAWGREVAARIREAVAARAEIRAVSA